MIKTVLFLSFMSALWPAKVYINRGPKETRDKIAIIDSGIIINEETVKYMCRGPHYDLTYKGLTDIIEHGTNIAGIIAKKIDVEKQCLLIIKYHLSYEEERGFKGNLDREVEALKIALHEKVRIVNFSSGGTELEVREQEMIRKLLDKNIYFITAAGNEGSDLDAHCDYYPACYNFKSPYFKIVGNGYYQDMTFNGQPIKALINLNNSNVGGLITDWRIGKDIEGFGIKLSGTSQSTAIKTSEIVKEMK